MVRARRGFRLPGGVQEASCLSSSCVSPMSPLPGPDCSFPTPSQQQEPTAPFLSSLGASPSQPESLVGEGREPSVVVAAGWVREGRRKDGN